jgi:hypothetical protein
VLERSKISGWERSKLSAQDHKLLKKMGMLKKEAMKMPRDESSPHPPIGYRVTFIDFLTRGLAVPIHEFLRGLIFYLRDPAAPAEPKLPSPYLHLYHPL